MVRQLSRTSLFPALAVLAAWLAPVAVQATPARGLPEGWSLGEVAPSHFRRSDPADRRGTFLHGEHGDIADAADWDRTARQEACSGRTGKPTWPAPPALEYWYYEADREGLLLLRSREFSGLDADCNTVIRVTDSVERVVIGSDSFTRFTRSGNAWSAETRRFADYRFQDRNDVGIGNGWATLPYFVVRKRRLDESRVGIRIGKAQTHCVGYASPPDAGGSLCWLAGNGPGRGILTYDMELIAGGPNLYHNVTEVEDGVMLDGRLFAWDRPITPP